MGVGFMITVREVSPARTVRWASCVNFISTFQNPEVITWQRRPSRAVIINKTEQALGSIIGFLEPLLAQKVHSSPFGVIPKHQGSKDYWIFQAHMDYSVNDDNINLEWYSLSYISVNDHDVARVVTGLGRGTMLGKMDIKSAYT